MITIRNTVRTLYLHRNNACEPDIPPFGVEGLTTGSLRNIIATWLILPVVIRSSQRLSHACLSINLLL